jgi:hypothetical protein
LTVASSAVGIGTTGGIRSTALCRNGIGILSVSKFNDGATEGKPVTKINTEATMNGDQPLNMSTKA